jgi:hypothetical protein
MLLTPCLVPLCLTLSSSTDVAPRGTYVEARTASVYAGACHYGGEATTAGREALLAWHIDTGNLAGVDLAGANVAVAIADDVNLAEAPESRRSVVYVDAKLTPAQQSAACAWLASAHADLVGQVDVVRSAPLDFSIGADTYSVSAPDLFELSGTAMPDRACCKMPFNVWYAPFESLEARVVGNDSTFAFHDPALRSSWSRPNENAAFVGRFGSR